MSKARASLIMILGVMLATCAPGTAPDGQPASPSPQATPTRSAELAATTSPSPSSCANCDAATSSPQPTHLGTPPAPGGSDTWVAAGAFYDHRVGTQLARLGTGEVLAVGDDLLCGIENAETDTAELWEPVSGAWRMAAPLPAQRNMIILVGAADGDALVTGGANSDYVAKSSTVVFDDRTQAWSKSGLLNTARMEFAAAGLPDGRVFGRGRSAHRLLPPGGRPQLRRDVGPGTGHMGGDRRDVEPALGRGGGDPVRRPGSRRRRSAGMGRR